MVWTALWQWAVPMIAFEQYESKAYLDYYDVSEKPAGGASNKDHYTRLVMAWEQVMFVNTALWGPMFIFGILSLSDLIQPITALYIEHVISNLYIPAYLYGAYSFYERAVYKETWQGWGALALYTLMSLITYFIQRY